MVGIPNIQKVKDHCDNKVSLSQIWSLENHKYLCDHQPKVGAYTEVLRYSLNNLMVGVPKIQIVNSKRPFHSDNKWLVPQLWLWEDHK